MLVVLAIAAAAVLAAVVAVAVGRGGELTEFQPDHPPLDLPEHQPITGTDVALLRLPAGLGGYNFRATDEALRRIAQALSERDTQIAVLEQENAELRAREQALRPALPERGRATSRGEPPPVGPETRPLAMRRPPEEDDPVAWARPDDATPGLGFPRQPRGFPPRRPPGPEAG